MLIDQDYADIFPLLCERIECSGNGRLLHLVVDYKEVSLRIWWLGNMSNAGE